jgi:hypothetical protein
MPCVCTGKRLLALLVGTLCCVGMVESFVVVPSAARRVYSVAASWDGADGEETTPNSNATDVKVFRSKGGGTKKQPKEYKIVDRRDALPFSVQLQPAPSDTLRATVYSSTDSDNNDEILPKVLLGEFALDASTTSGDTIGIGTQLYRVVRHRCLYQYQQKSFRMVRKILEVKELNRYRTEEYLQRQYALSATSPPPPEEH